MSLVEIEICKHPTGQPYIKLTGNALPHAEKLGVTELKLSLTHTKDHAAAYAVVIC